MDILSIDGGGVSGSYAASILARTQAAFAVDFPKRFDLIAGTSAGAIIAAGLALDVSAVKISDIFSEQTPNCFQPAPFSVSGVIRAKYDATLLHQVLTDAFADATLADVKTKLLITATDIGKGTIHLFRSYPLKDEVPDKNVKIADAVLASCSAPTYFRPAYVESHLVADGGMWANNPTLVAIGDALELQCQLQDIHVLSVGTGISRKSYPISQKDSMWGLITAWGIEKFIDLLINLQVISAQKMSRQLLGSKNLIRLNFETDQNLPPDQIELIAMLKSRADSDFTKYAATLAKLFKKKTAQTKQRVTRE